VELKSKTLGQAKPLSLMKEDKEMRYIEIEQQLDYYSIDKLKEKLNHYSNAIEEYAFIVHDKDINKEGVKKKVHFHCDIKFKSKCYTFERLAKMFDIKAQYISKPKKPGENGYRNMLSYLTHSTDGAEFKYKYDHGEVVASFDYSKRIEEIANEVSEATGGRRVQDLIKAYANFDMSKRALIKALSFDEYNKNIRSINNAEKYRNEKAKGIDREMKVIYISGGAGSGKTTLAKFMAKRLGFDVFISGSGEDVFDGYENEEAIILDDLRGDTFKKHEIFKLLDNNTGSGVKSRYFNKIINRCRLLFITSVQKPCEMYDWKTGSEPAKQFVRRLGGFYLYIEDDGKIYEVKIDENTCWDDGRKLYEPLNMNIVYSIQGIMKDSPGLASIMDEVSKKARQELEKQSEDLPF